MNQSLLVLQWRELILSRHIRCISGILFNICRGFVNSRAILSFFVTEFDQIRDSYVYIVMRCGYFILYLKRYFTKSFFTVAPDSRFISDRDSRPLTKKTGHILNL